jgi:outer membrane protein assembly factor BamD
MVFAVNMPKRTLVATLSLGLLASCIHKKYETPITKNTQQPDKVLFDQAIKDIEHGRYEVARISLQTLMNTYESSEFLAKAKLAVADSWFREGGSSGMAQAEAEYKDFILFYPSMQESAEAQNRVCEIHYKQMEKSDRDWSQTLRAETECRQLIQQFPNSKFAPIATQRLRNIQESLAEHEYVVGDFYWHRQMMPAAANRLIGLVDQYPLYSKAGESLYEAGDAYAHMGPRFRKEAGEEFTKIVRDYPMSAHADAASKRLQELEMPVPKPDPAALERAKYEEQSYKAPGMVSRTMGIMKSTPDVSHAAHSGAPTMTDPKRLIPTSVPVPATTLSDTTAGNGAGNGTTDVSATPITGSSALDKNPDARGSGGTAQSEASTTAQTPAQQQPLPTNRDADLKKLREKQAKKQAKLDKNKKKGKDQPQQPAVAPENPAQTQVPASPASANPATPTPTPQTPPQE